MRFILWNAATGTLVGEYPTEAEALAVVGQQPNLVLIRHLPNGRAMFVAEGQNLIRRANPYK